MSIIDQDTAVKFVIVVADNRTILIGSSRSALSRFLDALFFLTSSFISVLSLSTEQTVFRRMKRDDGKDFSTTPDRSCILSMNHVTANSIISLAAVVSSVIPGLHYDMSKDIGRLLNVIIISGKVATEGVAL